MTVDVEHLQDEAETAWMEHWKQGPTRLHWTVMPPQVGEPAPDLELEDVSGNGVHLSDFWRERPALLLFWRHYGCGCGVDRASRLQQEHEGYRSAGANVLVIGQGKPLHARWYAEKFGIPCPVLCDPEFRAYRAYGLLEFTPAQVLYDASDELLRLEMEAGKALARERRDMGRPMANNPWQSPGEFVVDPSGRIRLAYRYQFCEDFPDPRIHVSAIREARE